MSNQFSKGIQEITMGEHISPEKTGDNIEAKKVAGYIFNPSTLQWQRDTGSVGNLPTSTLNPSYVLSTVTVGLVSTITLAKTIGVTTYHKTVTIDSSTGSVTESAWS